MKLDLWLAENNKTAHSFSQELGWGVNTVKRYSHPKAPLIPEKKKMIEIYVKTNGKVQPNDFYPLPDLSKSPRSHRKPRPVASNSGK